VKFEIVSERRDQLGECPLWDVHAQCLYWIDTRRQLVQRLDPASGRYRSWTMPYEVGSIALCQSGRVLVALESDLRYLDLASGELAPLTAVTHAAERMRLNDGRTDRTGRFCVGSMVLGRHEPLGVLYQVHASGQVRELDRGIRTSNSTCFSPDGRWMYFADSLAGEVWRYRYDPATGETGPREAFIDARTLGSPPDGATVDAWGRLWVALVRASQLACFSSDGRPEQRIDLPVPFASCPCFGGPELDTIYMTSIRDSGNVLKSDHPDAGALLAIHGTGARGLPEARFADANVLKPRKDHDKAI
jgi:sugar lactone lactonase YvrE